MKKNILLIGPHKLFPLYSGIAVRTYNFIKYLKEMNYNVDGIYPSSNDTCQEEKKIFRNYFKIKIKENKIKKIYYRLRNKIFPVSVGSKILCPPEYFKAVKYLTQCNKYDIILIQYIDLSPLLKIIPSYCMKIIDTCDVMYERYNAFKNIGLHKLISYYSNKKREIKLLNKFDYIIAISKYDYAVFKKNISEEKIIYMPIDFQVNISSLPDNNIAGFIASDGPNNIDAFYYFQNNILPLIKKEIKDFKLLVAGTICNKLNSNKSNDIIYYGSYTDPSDVYKKISLVVIPLRAGSGLKIKLLEALSFAKPVVATSIATKGTDVKDGQTLLIADNVQLFSKKVIELCKNKKLKNNLSINAANFIKKYYNKKKVYEHIDKVINY